MINIEILLGFSLIITLFLFLIVRVDYVGGNKKDIIFVVSVMILPFINFMILIGVIIDKFEYYSKYDDFSFFDGLNYWKKEYRKLITNYKNKILRKKMRFIDPYGEENWAE